MNTQAGISLGRLSQETSLQAQICAKVKFGSETSFCKHILRHFKLESGFQQGKFKRCCAQMCPALFFLSPKIVMQVENPCFPAGCLDLFDSDWFWKCESREKLLGAERHWSQDDWWFSKCEGNKKLLGVKRRWSQDASRAINSPRHFQSHHLDIYLMELRLLSLLTYGF